MPIIAKRGEIIERQLIPADTYQAVAFDVWDLGMQKSTFNGEEKIMHKVKIGWEINEPIPEGDYKGKRYTIYKDYTLSLGDKANLLKDLESWRGKQFTDPEKDGFDIERLVGNNCLLSIIHKTAKSGNVYAMITGVTKLPKSFTPIAPENKRGLPEWIKRIQDQAIPPEVHSNGHAEEPASDDFPFPPSEE